MKKEVKGIISEGIYVPFYDRNLGGRNSNPNDALRQVEQSLAIVGLRVSHVTYDLKTGTFSRSSWEEYNRAKLPNMVRYDYYLLRKGMSPEAAMQGTASHYFWDVFWSVTTAEEPDVVGIVVKKVVVAPTGEVIEEEDPFVLKAFGQSCGEGEIPMPAGLQSIRRSK